MSGSKQQQDSSTVTDLERIRVAEEGRKRLHHRLQKVIECSSIGIWEWSHADDTLTWDKQMFRIYGVDPSDFRGVYEDWTDRIHPDDFERVTTQEPKELKLDRNGAKEFRIVRPNGDVRHLYTNVGSEMDENGQPACTFGVNIDITDRKSAQLALHESETRFQLIAENVSGAVVRYVVHPDGTDELAYVSSGAREVFGFDLEEVLGDGVSKVWERVHVDDRDRIANDLAAAAEKLEQVVVEYRLNVPGKGQRWVQSSLQPVRSENGDIVWDGVVLDHTESRATQLALQEAQTQFRRMTENVPGMIYRYVLHADGSHAMTYVGVQCRELFGVEPKAVIENVDLLFKKIHPDDAKRVITSFRDSAKTMKPFNEVFRVHLPGYELRWLEDVGQPTRNEDGDTIWDGVIVDITERKQAELKLQIANEELARATKMKDEFLATMSHELRTPLNAILSTSEALQEGVFRESASVQREAYSVIQQSGEHLLTLINEVLDLAQIESGSINLQVSTVDIRDLCDSSLQLIAQQAEKKNIELNLSVPFGLPKLAVDEMRIRQVLVNLLSNAVKFTGENGTVTLDVRRQKSVDSQETIRIAVTDTGIGIAPNRLDSLFDPFVQVDSSLSRAYEGTGLGLTIVKRFVELHAGKVAVTSQVGIGSCFVVDLPFHKIPSAVAASSSSSRISDQEECHSRTESPEAVNLRILVAEDNETSANVITKCLEYAGHQVVLASDGQAAVDAVRESVPDVVLIDIQMPVMDGLEATRQIRAMPGLENLPIIAVTGLAMPGDAARCLRAGANNYVCKPYKLEALMDAIHELLQDKVDR